MKRMTAGWLAVALAAAVLAAADERTYPIVDTAQVRCYDDRTEIAYPKPGQPYHGQDAQYDGNPPAYRDHGDGTVTDRTTHLIWQADPGAKKTYAQAVAGAKACRTAGHDDWRLPTIKELYSLILFRGTDPDPMARDAAALTPFIDRRYFKFQYGQVADGERIIDSQWATSTRYVSTTMGSNATMFGVNFADGRIKGYPIDRGPGGRAKTYYAIYVRGNPRYGHNDFHDNGDGTVTDRATGLTWMQADSAALKAGRKRDGKLNWPEALQWAQSLTHAGRSDWRLPNAKELHSIVDYTRSPDTTNSAAIDPNLHATPIRNEAGRRDWGQYWTSTTHARATSAESAVYIAFGRALGFMSDRRRRDGAKRLLDVHGAGAQRCDRKKGDPAAFSQGRGPQGDVMRIYNLARCVRGGKAQPRTAGPKVKMKYAPRRPGRSNRPGTGADFIRRHDRNADGKVSRTEFPGPDDHFRHLDQNHDGHITPNEAPTGSPPIGRQPARP